MKTNLALLTLLMITTSTIIFSGCTEKTSLPTNNPTLNENTNENIQELTPEQETQVIEKMKDPLTDSNNLDDLEAELDATIILEEDFGDI